MLMPTPINDRRAFFLALATAAALPAIERKPVGTHALPTLHIEGWDVNAVEVTFGPGESSAAHRHPGFVVGYVLEGKFRHKLDGGDEQILEKGSLFYEPPGGVHRVSGNASKTESAKILALVFAPKGEPLTKPA